MRPQTIDHIVYVVFGVLLLKKMVFISHGESVNIVFFRILWIVIVFIVIERGQELFYRYGVF